VLSTVMKRGEPAELSLGLLGRGCSRSERPGDGRWSGRAAGPERPRRPRRAAVIPPGPSQGPGGRGGRRPGCGRRASGWRHRRGSGPARAGERIRERVHAGQVGGDRARIVPGVHGVVREGEMDDPVGGRTGSSIAARAASRERSARLGSCQPRQQAALRPAAANGLGAQSRPVEHRQPDDAVARGAAIAKCRYRRRDSDPLR
jgi:hypothetical protein